MKTRIITAIVAILILLPVCWFAETAAFPVAAALCCAMAAWEMLHCIGAQKKILLTAICLTVSAACPLFARWLPEWLPVLLAGAFLCLLVCKVCFFRSVDAAQMALLTTEITLITLGFSCLVLVRDAQPKHYLLIFIAAWATDTCALFAGKFLGKKKLCPDISPKKTVAGSIGGVIGAILGFLIYGLIVNACYNMQVNLCLLCLLAIPLSIIGQFGDLSASVVKRHFGVKDYGKIFPGHGGVLDRFDSILPIALCAWLLVCVAQLLQVTL